MNVCCHLKMAMDAGSVNISWPNLDAEVRYQAIRRDQKIGGAKSKCFGAAAPDRVTGIGKQPNRYIREELGCVPWNKVGSQVWNHGAVGVHVEVIDVDFSA